MKNRGFDRLSSAVGSSKPGKNRPGSPHHGKKSSKRKTIVFEKTHLQVRFLSKVRKLRSTARTAAKMSEIQDLILKTKGNCSKRDMREIKN